jgi:hypothetical protein
MSIYNNDVFSNTGFWEGKKTMLQLSFQVGAKKKKKSVRQYGEKEK